jgi:hypothetical protein
MAQYQTYTSIGTVISTDITAILHDPSGVPLTQQASMDKIFNDMQLHSANVTRSTLAADGTLAVTADPIQWYDPNGTARNIYLPGTASTNHGFLIKNIGSNAAETALTVQAAAGTATLATLRQDEAEIFISDGTQYKRLGKNKPIPVQIRAIAPTTSWAVGSAFATFYVPAELHGMNLIYGKAWADTAGTTGAGTVQVRNVTDGTVMMGTLEMPFASGSSYYFLGTVDPARDDVVANDQISIDILGIHTTAAKGLTVELGFRLP